MVSLKEKIVRSRYIELTEDEQYTLNKAITLFEEIGSECEDCIVDEIMEFSYYEPGNYNDNHYFLQLIPVVED